MSSQIIPLKGRTDFRGPSEFQPQRLFAFELRRPTGPPLVRYSRVSACSPSDAPELPGKIKGGGHDRCIGFRICRCCPRFTRAYHGDDARLQFENLIGRRSRNPRIPACYSPGDEWNRSTPAVHRKGRSARLPGGLWLFGLRRREGSMINSRRIMSKCCAYTAGKPSSSRATRLLGCSDAH